MNSNVTIGKLTLPNGGKYEGEIIDGMSNGKGIVKLDSGEKWEGTFINGVPNGQCKRSWDDGMYIEGVFKNAQPVGDVKLYQPNVGLFEGPLNGRGKCKMTYPDGSYYIGECLDKQPDGWGTKVQPGLSESESEGEWRNGDMHGYFVDKVSDAFAAQVNAPTGWTDEGIITQGAMRKWFIKTAANLNGGKPTVIRAADKNFDIPQEDLPLGIKARLFLGFIDMCKEKFPIAFYGTGSNNSGFSTARAMGNWSVNEINRQEEEWKSFSEKILPLPIEQKAEVYYNWLVDEVQTAESVEEYTALAKKFSDISEYKNCAEIAALICEQLETK
ncbi:MAG: hypothetical protein LBN23_00410 [Paludibacter sp.]|jgi:hypothetical protein|nr:hypothetical protein [Paludibacter sp.]